MGELVKGNPKQSNSVYSEPWQINLKALNERWAYVLTNQLFADVTFCVGPEDDHIPCHRIVLIVHSPVFETMFSVRWNNYCENNTAISLPEEDPRIFRMFLQFLYGETVNTSVVDDTIALLVLAKKYLCPSLVAKCVQILKAGLKERNVVEVYQTAQMLDEPSLEKAAEQFILNNAESLAQTEEFSKFSEDNLRYFLTHDDLNVGEVELFNALCKWGQNELERRSELCESGTLYELLKDLLKHIRFTLMTCEEFSCEVVSKNILPLQQTVDVFRYLTTPLVKRPDVEPQIEMKFNTKSRSRKVYSYVFQRLKGHGYDFGRKWQNICFQVDGDIKLISLGFFRAVSPDATLEVGIRIQDFDLTQTFAEILDEVIQCNTTQEVFHVKFPQPVGILKDVPYTISYIIKGKETFYKTEGPPKIALACGSDRKLNFCFKEAKADTDLDQVPELCFRL